MELANKIKSKLRMARKNRRDFSALSIYFSKEELSKIKKFINNGEAVIDTERIPISFLISGQNLIAQIRSSKHDFTWHNSQIKNTHYSRLYYEFANRAFDVLQSIIVPELIGLREEKQATAAILFGKDLKILCTQHSGKLSAFLKEFGLADKLVSLANCRGLNKLNIDDFDFVFKPERPKSGTAMNMLCNEEVVKGDIEFLKGYSALAAQFEVEFPKEYKSLIDNFVEKQGRNKKFSLSVEKLAKAFARMELRNRVAYRDLYRAFSVASHSLSLNK